MAKTNTIKQQTHHNPNIKQPIHTTTNKTTTNHSSKLKSPNPQISSEEYLSTQEGPPKRSAQQWSCFVMLLFDFIATALMSSIL